MNELVEKILTIDSREVSKMLERRHSDLLRDVEIYSNYLSESTERKIALSEFWKKSEYKDCTGRFLKCYLITKKGCEFIAHKMTGKKGAIFTATYINRFHAMEEALKHPTAKQLPEPLKCKYFRGVPCTTILDLAVLAGIDRTYVLQLLKAHQIPYLMLSGQDLLDYRKENRAFKTNSRLIILSKQSVTELLRNTGKDTVANLERVRQYFHLPKEPVRRETRLNTELTIRQLYVLRNTLPYLVSKEDRGVLAKYIVDRLMELDLFRPSDYPCENIYDMDINSVAGWNTSSCIQNAHTLIERGVQVTRQALLDFKDGLLD